jgi:hypothetical protein
MEKKLNKRINISDKELDRDIVNLQVPEVDIYPEDVPCYSPEFEAWLKSGRKGKVSDYVKK